MEIQVKLFGNEARLAGVREVVVEVGGVGGGAIRSEDLFAAVVEACPVLGAHVEGCRLAVNHEFVKGDVLIGEGDEVALIGAVSGG